MHCPPRDMGADGRQDLAMNQIAAGCIQYLHQPDPAAAEVERHQLGVPTLIGVVTWRWPAQSFRGRATQAEHTVLGE
jgi:hypothetical protein